MYVSEIKQRLPSASVMVTYSCLTGRCTLGPGFFHIQIYAVRGLPTPVSVGSSEPDSHLSDLIINGLWNSYACFVWLFSQTRRSVHRHAERPHIMGRSTSSAACIVVFFPGRL